MDELFVPIEGYPNYEVSNYGRVVNVRFDRDLKTKIRRGWAAVCLYHEGVARTFSLHRLVAQAFFLNYLEGEGVEHINGNHEDNAVSNLHLTGVKVRGKDV